MNGEFSECRDHPPSVAEFGCALVVSSSLAKWSKDGSKLAMVDEGGKRLLIRDSCNMEIVPGGLHSCLKEVEVLEWSPDGDLIFCGMLKEGLVQIFSISRPEWHCRVKEGVAGLSKVQWVPDSRHILTFSDFGLHLNLWCLVTKKVHQIRQPTSIDFSPDGCCMAVAVRRNCHDSIGMYDATSMDWTCTREFSVETTDLVRIKWSPDGGCVAVQDGSLEYAVLLYSPEGQLFRKYVAYENALGVKLVSWHPQGLFLAVSSYDEEVRLLSPPHWRSIAEFKHVHPRQQPPWARRDGTVCWREVATDKCVETMLKGQGRGKENLLTNGDIRKPKHSKKGENDFKKKLLDGEFEISFEEKTPPIPLPSVRSEASTENPKVGASMVIWSADGRFMATRNDNMPRLAWIWDVESFSLASVMLQISPIRHMQWSPEGHTLAIATGTRRIYLWTPHGASWVDVTPDAGDFGVVGCKWQPKSGKKGMLLLSRTRVIHVRLSIIREEEKEEEDIEGSLSVSVS